MPDVLSRDWQQSEQSPPLRDIAELLSLAGEFAQPGAQGGDALPHPRQFGCPEHFQPLVAKDARNDRRSMRGRGRDLDPADALQIGLDSPAIGSAVRKCEQRAGSLAVDRKCLGAADRDKGLSNEAQILTEVVEIGLNSVA